MNLIKLRLPYKFLWLFAITMVAFCLASIAQVHAQNANIIVDTTGVSQNPFLNPSVEKFVQWYHWLYSAILIVVGWLGKYIKLFRNVPNYYWVVLVAGFVIAGIFVVLGFGNGLTYVIPFALATNLYDALRPIFQRISPPKGSS